MLDLAMNVTDTSRLGCQAWCVGGGPRVLLIVNGPGPMMY